MTNEEFEKLKIQLTNQKGLSSSEFEALRKKLQLQQKLKQQQSVKGGILGNIFTSATQKFGRTMGETLALKKNMQLYTDALKSFTDAQYNLTKTISTNKKTGKDTSRLEQVLSEMRKPNISDFVGEQTARRLNETLAQNIAEIGGQALGTVVEATGVGAIKGVKGLGLVKNVAKTADEARKAKLAYNALSFGGKMGNIAKNTARMAGAALPFGYAYDVSQGLQGERGVGREGGKAFIPGAGTALSVAIPAGVGALRTAQAGFAKVSPTIASNISGEPVQAYERMQTGQLKGMLKGASREKTLDVARGAMTGYRKNMIKEFGENIENLSVKNQGFRIGLDDTLAKKAGKISETFGFDLPQNIKSMSGKEASEFITNLNESYIPNASTANDIALNNSVKTLKNTLMNKANQTFGKEFGDIYKTYAGKSKVYKDIASVIGKVGERTPMQLNAARNRLNNIFAENSSAYLEAVQQFENATGAKILDQVAAARLSPILPKTLRGGGFNIMGLAGDIFALLTFPISSPRVGGQIIKFLSGMDVNTLSKLPNTVRMAIYNAVDKENMSFNDAVKKYAKDFIKNPKMGLSLEDVSKNQSGKTTWSTDLSTVTTKPITKNQNKTLSTNISKSITQKTAVGKGVSPENSQTFYHTTTVENASSIEKGGFKGNVGEMSKASGGNMQKGVFLYDEQSSANAFGKNFKNPKVLETKVEGKIYDANTNTKYGWEDDLQTQEIAKSPEIIAQLKKDGYVGVKSTEMGTNATFVFEPKAVKVFYPENSLISEAKKYKSAEEFVKAQGTPVYHGSDSAGIIQKEGFKLGGTSDRSVGASSNIDRLGKGIYFADNPKDAARYAKSWDTKDVVNSYIKPDVKIKEFPDYQSWYDFVNKENPKAFENPELLNAIFEKQGYGGVKLAGDTVVFDPKNIKTKSQLTDIWKKANNK